MYDEAELLDTISGEFIDYYEYLVDLLRQDETLTKLVEILFGPVFTATRYDAERLRHQGLLRRTLASRLGDNWLGLLPVTAPRLANAVARWTELFAREKRQFAALAVSDVLDYANPLDLLQIMNQFWDDFRPLLGNHPKAYWETRFQVLARVRNPLAYSRPVEKKALVEAEEYCHELLNLLAAPQAA